MTVERRPRRLEWLRDVQKAYPGSRRGNIETHGLDSDFARQTYVATGLESQLLDAVTGRRFRLIILCGNAGDGKTALLQNLAGRLGLGNTRRQGGPVEYRLADGLRVRFNLDGSAAWEEGSSDLLLDQFLAPFVNGPPSEDIVHLLAINDGRLLSWLGRGREATPLARSLLRRLDGNGTDDAPHIGLFHLNRRSLVGEFDATGQLTTGFLDALLDQLYGSADAATMWQKCGTCVAQPHCPVFRAATYFGPDNLPGRVAAPKQQHARHQLYRALQAVHQLGKLHLTIRDLRGTLVYILFGTASCDAHCKGKPYPPYWDRVFDAQTPDRQGELLAALTVFDPAREADARLDRYLLASQRQRRPNLAGARRQAYFELLPETVAQIGGKTAYLGLARGRHLDLLQQVPLLSDAERRSVVQRLGRGLSKAELLPPLAYAKTDSLPFRIHPRTPTDTVFWIETRLDAFAVEAAWLDVGGLGPDRRGLPHEAFLAHRNARGQTARLRLTADLFHVLLELERGYQLSAATLDETFAHLALFIEQIIQNHDGDWYAWHPTQEDRVYRLRLTTRDLGHGFHQVLTVVPD
ncbi:MAG: hypothetical protein SNJ67_08105 [Chloracidobacterium sp.]|uniref:Rad50/SbcC-type AAA domain-containing protein n=1 Tax=Chloracidobacterium validum TaxID=2821543 RepID=A0ABX8BFV7_9BACT|nr:hypothetical protein [Chloracidobacterium validum]QUW04559.1 hypothetical protein J8C06_12305 [Chloracidobacterium validum]